MVNYPVTWSPGQFRAASLDLEKYQGEVDCISSKFGIFFGMNMF